ncbi:MAG TPA: J domain-containing protein [Polyangiales bacterium]|nr:J domain-containing protein [Polyangiales bacterium]
MRLLFALSGTRREQELRLEQGGRVVRIALRDGQLFALEGVPLTPLGDLLRELSMLDGARAGALREGGTGVPIGVRLIAAGATSWSAVQRALALQRARGLEWLLRMPVTRVRRTRGVPVRGVGVSLTDALWTALRAMAAQLPETPRLALTLTSAGRRHASLHEDHALLLALGFATPAAQREDAYALLLRKRRELARNVGPRALLDLPSDADARGAQRALRKLAGKLHPDRFLTEDARLHRVSHEVMGALTRAASSFVA